MRLARPLASAGNVGNVGVPAVGQLAPLHQPPLFGQLGILLRVLGELLLPLLARLLAALADACREMLDDFLGHQELLVLGPAVNLLGRA